MRALADHATIVTQEIVLFLICLLYTSDAADERSSVDLGGRRIIKKKNIWDDSVLPSKREEQTRNNEL